MGLSLTAQRAVQKIVALRKYPVPATEKAVQRILASLNLQDLTDVTFALENLDIRYSIAASRH